MTKMVNIIGAGLAGLSAAITLARQGVACRLISSQPSERAQSVLAEGGINAALNTMGEDDTPEEHFADTMKGGCFLESEKAVQALTENAPDIVRELFQLGVPFRSENGKIILRNFGGQAKKRTAFAKSSTGKMIMTALIDEVRRYEVSGLVKRYSHHELVRIKVKNKKLESMIIKDHFKNEFFSLTGRTILCTGGMNGFFEGMTTGTTQNTGNVAAVAFQAGVEFADLEFIQYHPTTVGISNKRMLISEAARGEGGRLFILRNQKKWYFMEEKYPELGNLMPRDVVSREIFFVKRQPDCTGEVYLDMTGLDDSIWQHKLSDLRSEIISYLHIDPRMEPIAVSPGIHFFMGGIRVNKCHETNIKGLYAAGEAACKYHGANRLGGNSMLGAVFGGKVAAKSAAEYADESEMNLIDLKENIVSSPENRRNLKNVLLSGLGIVREPAVMQDMLENLKKLYCSNHMSEIDKMRINLGLAMIESAIARKESRGAHYRTDFPETDEKYQKLTVIKFENGKRILKFISADSEEEI